MGQGRYSVQKVLLKFSMHTYTGGVYQTHFQQMEGSGDKTNSYSVYYSEITIDAICMYDRTNSSHSLSSLCHYSCGAAHAQAVIKELKHCPQLERLT